jgi:thiosulfate dehydrogenase [quinone] large subunit
MTLALLPLRVFLGVTFVYAGVDKLIDPVFLHATGPGSIGSQLDAFVRVSPIAPLIQVFGQTFPVQIGFLIAIAEIAIGLGTLTGILFRLSAAGGLALSVMFWLTASWATKPYYYGPDLPYALGWLTLAIAGTGGRFTVDTWLARAFDGGEYGEPASLERRLALKTGFLGIGALAVAGLAGTVGASVLGRPRTALGAGTASPAPTSAGGVAGQTAPPSPVASAPPSAAADPTQTTAPVPAATASGPQVARVSQLATGHAIAFDDPVTGDPGVLIKLHDGSIVAFDAVCTHAGCTVEYDRRSGYLLCPCHGAAFDPMNDAQAIAGPTNQPLAKIPIHIDTASGKITLTAG